MKAFAVLFALFFLAALVQPAMAQTPPNLTLFSPNIVGVSVSINGVTTPSAPGTTITRIGWNWGDGVTEDHWFPNTHIYAVSGTYLITVVSWQSDGYSSAKTVTVTVGSGPAAPPQNGHDVTLIAVAIIVAAALIAFGLIVSRKRQ